MDSSCRLRSSFFARQVMKIVNAAKTTMDRMAVGDSFSFMVRGRYITDCKVAFDKTKLNKYGFADAFPAEFPGCFSFVLTYRRFILRLPGFKARSFNLEHA